MHKKPCSQIARFYQIEKLRISCSKDLKIPLKQSRKNWIDFETKIKIRNTGKSTKYWMTQLKLLIGSIFLQGYLQPYEHSKQIQFPFQFFTQAHGNTAQGTNFNKYWSFFFNSYGGWESYANWLQQSTVF